MSCEKYKAALIEAAAIGKDAASDDALFAVRSHAESCPSCAAELAEQRSLLAAIDSRLRRAVNAPLPPALLQRFEARLAQEPQSPPSRSLRFTWLCTAAAFATAAALILFALSHQRAHKSNSQFTTLAQTAKSTSDHRPEIMTAILPPASPEEIRRDREQHRRHTAHIASASTTLTHAEPEVLVPPDEQIALDRFVARGKVRREFVVALATTVHQGFEPSFKDLEIPDINTAEIVIQPIATESRR
jgi:hypothetical protein